MHSIVIDDFRNDLAQLTEQNALELHAHINNSQKTDYYIPYMMNDAVECYYILENCRTTGSYLPDYTGNLQAELVQQAGTNALIIHQGEEQVFTIWFDSLQKKLQCYRYHEIGHFWVEGQEQWRQLVYMAGTIYDKYEYLGETICNKKEMELLPLMEFAPFRYWSPIHESILDEYPDTIDGVELMQTLASEAGDKQLLFLLKLYAAHPSQRLMGLLIRYLSSHKGQAVYQVIWKKIAKASSEYPARDYGSEKNRKIQEERDRVTTSLRRQGYSGTYPVFWKENIQVVIGEEHPFTILDWEDFKFRVQYMVSESRKKTPNKMDMGNVRTNYGFFRKWGNRGRIEKK